ncbi:glycerophosphodiester phosphodiesterase [Jatrophihabitans sp. YIM 134969]
MSSLAATPPPPSRTVTRRTFVAALAGAACLATCGSAAATPARATASAAATPLQAWLTRRTIRIAHRGGSADWPEASPLAYRNAAAWNRALALEFPARRTADGVWIASEDASTGRVFGRDLTIATSTWAQVSTLRSVVGAQPPSRLKQTVLDQVSRDRILFVDDKDDDHVDELLDLLDQYGGRRRAVVKSFHQFVDTPRTARARGYTTWGYWYEDQMGDFDDAQRRFDLLGMEYGASEAVFDRMTATGKRVLAHIVATEEQADLGLSKGATGLMVSGVEEVVPHS